MNKLNSLNEDRPRKVLRLGKKGTFRPGWININSLRVENSLASIISKFHETPASFK